MDKMQEKKQLQLNPEVDAKSFRRIAADSFPALLVLFLAVIAAAFLLTGCTSAPGADSQGTDPSVSAEELLQSGSWQEAADAYQAEIDSGHETEDNYRCLGIAQMGLGSYEPAAGSFETALTHAGVIPTDIEYDINFYLGSCYYKLGRFEDALQVYDAIVVLKPRNADAVEMRGAVRMQLGDTDGMNRDFERAISLEPSNYDRLISIYQALASNGQEEQGKQYLQDALDRDSSGMSNYDRGRLSYYVGDYDTARTCLEQIQDNTDYQVVLMLGRTYEALGDYNYASNVFQTYLSSDTSHGEVYNELGLCDLRMERYSDALDAFQDGQKTGEQNLMQSLSFNEIVAYEYLGEFQQAKTLMESYIASYPGDEKAKREYTFLESR